MLACLAIIVAQKHSDLAFYLCGLLLITFAAFRAPFIDNDYGGYLEYYNTINDGQILIVEPSYIVLSYFVKAVFNNVFFIFLIYAIAGVSLKLKAFKNITDFGFLSLLVYFCGYYLLFEMTQIRAGIAAGILLLCIKPLKDRRLFVFLTLALIAFLFHYSAIVIFPLYLLRSKKLNVKIYYLLVPAAYVMYFAKVDIFTLLSYLPIDLIQAKISSYSFYAEQDSKINLFNYLHLFRCVLAMLFIWKWKLLAEKNSYAVILIKIYVWGLFVFVAFANIPGISSRISELLLIVEIILIPFIFYICREKKIAILLILLISFGFLTFSLFYTKLFIGYNII